MLPNDAEPIGPPVADHEPEDKPIANYNKDGMQNNALNGREVHAYHT
jgi:hypothetical protein